MSTVAERIDHVHDGVDVMERATVAWRGLTLAGAVAAVVMAFAGARAGGEDVAWAAATLVAAWSIAALVASFARPAELLGMWIAVTALSGGAALMNERFGGVVPLAVAVLVVMLPTGALDAARGRASRVLVGVAVVVGGVTAIAVGARAEPTLGPVVVGSLVLAVVALAAYVIRCRRASAIDRARLQWFGWGVVVSGSVVLAVWIMYVLLGWPDNIGATVIAATIFVPVALALSAIEQLALRIDRLLVRTIEAGGVVALVGVVYVVVVLGFGDTSSDASKRVLGVSMIAAVVAALLFVPTRNWLVEFANRRVYGDRRAPDEPIQTFGARMSRAIPLDELLLQLAESLKKSMQLAFAQVWTGANGVYELAAAVPYRETTRVRLSDAEVAVVARARVSGNAWIAVWLPELLAQHPDKTLRIAPLVHSGQLLGVIVCGRNAEDHPFTDEHERTLTDLARQVALALHNSALDSALQVSLNDLEVANEELRASRARIVAAADQSRRQIERNLHDGAQQHLVALAVKLGLARQLVDSDPATVATLLEELRTDAQTTLTELRELAHGIYPPLLMDRGLREALVAAANRSTLPTDVSADVGRFPADIEAALYFCCLEALQNAGKHAGDGARITLTVTAAADELSFEVADDGAGFDAGSDAVRGHGFVNMRDRLGAIGGRLHVDSAPGGGTRIGGRVPLGGQEAEERSSQS